MHHAKNLAPNHITARMTIPIKGFKMSAINQGII